MPYAKAYIPGMRTTSASHFRKNLAAELDRVAADHEPLVVHRSGSKPSVAIIPLERLEMDETDYLLSTQANRKALLESIKQADEGKLIEFK
jgi:antitoxin YefM